MRFEFVVPVACLFALTAAGCASSSEQSASQEGAVSVQDDPRCNAIRSARDADEQARLADAYADENAAGYEACRKDLAATAATLDEFLTWASPEELAADATEDPTEAAPGEPTPQRGVVNVTVDIGSQRADIVGGDLSYSQVRVATGRQGYGTVRGCFDGFSAERNHWSKKYHANMPFTVFFFKGQALHQGSVSVRSHGCVHLTREHAEAVYNAYRKGFRIHVCVN
jgi:hypothetical protein